ncbi:hypothetical protein CFE70_004822 [Pyrenophora teres f. teres 0-1]|uniref:Uncharacterized protein n=2 Tax=Pyrenophora teres f. teres TaxID=97479 RepID=E3S6F3_PYRTT|nr:hypothetical protein PTT_18308 [Pyrenophora teres f. teres 0-1]KAE8840454.1 hypothetical protein PTNB85_03853 [Pyrenophora teres f. teres]KAE8849405.1 hypothetical protein HRS9122_03421 [Pyrenophora teres f. teres]KAE8863953.1 hypothetical protein PTNB29_03917 [Pyrenophora teres f. teres]KAE8866751.1 hypothetical protein PTNB73_04845 [Pyrenophora teres f. teres]
MLFSNIVFAVLAQSLTASAATMMVTVAANNKFQFTPNSITAQPGDTVAFVFAAQNHSVASSNANTPCQPQANALFSDFQPIAGNPKGSPNAANGRRQTANSPMFMVPVTDNQPMYIYCPQAQHCQQGMVMVINPPSAAAVTQYQNKAAQANNNVAPAGGINGGQMINNVAGTNPKKVLGAQAGDAAKGKGKAAGKAKAKGKAAAALAALIPKRFVDVAANDFVETRALGKGKAAAALAAAAGKGKAAAAGKGKAAGKAALAALIAGA